MNDYDPNQIGHKLDHYEDPNLGRHINKGLPPETFLQEEDDQIDLDCLSILDCLNIDELTEPDTAELLIQNGYHDPTDTRSCIGRKRQ